MKLFYVPGTCALSPDIVWREAGLTVETKLVDRKTKLVDGKLDYNQVNPLGYVPALELDDGTVLREGAVIIQYLADRNPDSRLIPKAGSLERYQTQEMLNFIATEIHKGFSPLFNLAAPKEVRETQMARLGTRFDWLSRHLEGRKFLMGDSFSVPDAYLFTCLRWSGERTGVDLSKWPALVAFQERVKARPRVQEALKAEGLA